MPDKAGAGPALRCAGLTKRLGGRTVVDHLSLGVEPGQVYGLLGPNGAGKTTTLSMISGLLAADEGTVEVCGQLVSPSTPTARAVIGYVPQEIALYPQLSALENLRFFGRLYGLGGRTLTRRIDEALDAVGLRERAKEKIETYSGGMQRRINIAAGLLPAPRLLILDEPTVGVDPQSRSAILDSVKEFARDGMAVLFASHYMGEVERLCDTVGVVDAGRMIAEGTPAELVKTHGGSSRLTLKTTGDPAVLAAAATGVAGVTRAAPVDGGVDVVADEPGALLPSLLAAAPAEAPVSAVELNVPDLETVFLALTGRALRDDG